MQAFSTQFFPANWLANSTKVALFHVLKLEALDPCKLAPDLFSLHECKVFNCTEEKDGGKNTKTKQQRSN